MPTPQMRKPTSNFAKTSGPAGFGSDPLGMIHGLTSIGARTLQYLVSPEFQEIMGQVGGMGGASGPAASVGQGFGREVGKSYQNPNQSMQSQGQWQGQQSPQQPTDPGMTPAGFSGDPTFQVVSNLLEMNRAQTRSQQAQQALQMGVSPEKIMVQQATESDRWTKLKAMLSGTMGFMGMDASKGLLNQGSYDERTGQVEQPSALFGLIRPTPEDKLANTEAYARQPGVAAQGELGKQEIVQRNKWFEDVMKPPQISGESAPKFQQSKDIVSSIDEILGYLEKDPRAIRELDRPGNRLGQRIGYLSKRIFANLATLRGGGSLPESELKLAKTLTTPTGLRALALDPRDAIQRLKDLRGTGQGIVDTLDPYASKREQIKSLTRQGFSRESIHEAFRRAGEA